MFHGRIRFFEVSRSVFLLFFPCIIVETIISLALCENNFLGNIFFEFSSSILQCLSFVRPLIRSFGIFSAKTVFFITIVFLKLIFLTSFLCTTPETTFRIFLNQNNLLKKVSIFKFHFFMSFLCRPIVAVIRNTLCKNAFSCEK